MITQHNVTSLSCPELEHLLEARIAYEIGFEQGERQVIIQLLKHLTPEQIASLIKIPLEKIITIKNTSQDKPC